jgi:hypothetical protein
MSDNKNHHALLMIIYLRHPDIGQRGDLQEDILEVLARCEAQAREQEREAAKGFANLVIASDQTPSSQLIKTPRELAKEYLATYRDKVKG